MTSEYKRFNGLGDVLATGRTGLLGRSGPAVGPVEYVNVPLGGEQVMTCVQFGLLLLRDGDLPLAAPSSRTSAPGRGNATSTEGAWSHW